MYVGHSLSSKCYNWKKKVFSCGGSGNIRIYSFVILFFKIKVHCNSFHYKSNIAKYFWFPLDITDLGDTRTSVGCDAVKLTHPSRIPPQKYFVLKDTNYIIQL